MAFTAAVNNVGQVADEVLWNQFADAFLALFGIDDPTATALLRLVLPRATSLPGSPEAGEMAIDTNVSADGRQYRYGEAGLWVPYLPYRQFARASTYVNAFTTNSLSWVVIDDAEVTLTTTGGRLKVWLSGGYISVLCSASTSAGASLGIFVDGVLATDTNGLFTITPGFTAVGIENVVNPQMYLPAAAFGMADIGGLAPGSHTVDLRALVSASDSEFGMSGARLIVEEHGD